MSLKDRILQDVKDAMRAKDKPRLATIRLITAAIKQREVDERIELDDTQVLVVLDKMCKQRRESISQFEQAGLAAGAAGEGDLVDVTVAHEGGPGGAGAVDDVDVDVVDLAAAVGEQCDADPGAVSGHRLVDRVVDDFPNQVMQPRHAHAADVHPRTLAHGIKAFQGEWVEVPYLTDFVEKQGWASKG